MIYYGKQSINEADIKAVVDVLQSDFLTQGPVLERFEKKVAEYCGAKYAVAVTNATSALHIACRAAGLGKGDVLWTSPITFTASANCGRYCGADVDFVDIDAATYNMSVDELSNKLQESKAAGRLPKVVVPVHLAGQSCDMKRIHELSVEYGFTVLEDASHAIGADYLGYNYRMTELQAALGFSQMDRLDEFVDRRRYLVNRYNELLQDLPVVIPQVLEGANPSWHLYMVRVDFSKAKQDKVQFFAEMKKRGIVLNLHYIPVHTQPYYQGLGFKQGDFPQSEKYYEEIFTLPLYYRLTEEQQDDVVAALRDCLK